MQLIPAPPAILYDVGIIEFGVFVDFGFIAQYVWMMPVYILIADIEIPYRHIRLDPIRPTTYAKLR
jgi:hypothetical protein